MASLSTENSQHQPLPFTVGIEVESLLVLKRHNPFSTPLDYLQHQFELAKLDSVTADSPKGVEHSYETWMITTDGSIDLNVPARALRQALKAAGKLEGPEGEVGEYECHGIELVSPPLLAPDVLSPLAAIKQEPLASIKRYLDVLDGNDTDRVLEHTAFPTPSCGLHVHVGLPESQPIPLPVLQQLAFLLLKYEDMISNLHHHSRTPFPGTQTSSFARSNRTSFLTSKHAAGCIKEKKEAVFDLNTAKRKIFANGMTIEKLAWMMGSDEILDDAGNVVGDDGQLARMDLWQDDPSWSWPSGWEEQGGKTGEAVEVGEDGSEASAPTWSGSERTAALSHSDFSSWEDSEIPSEWQTEGEWTRSNSLDDIQPLSASTAHFSDPNLESWFNASPNPFPEGNKFKLTRWNLLARHPCQGPRTIEFRQAAGSVDPHEIGETVRLFVALLRCAERAADATSEDADCCVDPKLDDAEVTLDGLLDLLRLPQPVRDYWTYRAERLAEEGFFALRDPSSLKHWQKCTACAASHDCRRLARLRQGEQTRGWQAFLKGNAKGKALWNKYSKHGVFKKDTWTKDSETVKPFDSKAVAQPVKFSRRSSKGKKPTTTRKEKATAKTRARVQAGKHAGKRWQKGLSACALIDTDGGYSAGPASGARSKIRNDEPWASVSAGAPCEPASGW